MYSQQFGHCHVTMGYIKFSSWISVRLWMAMKTIEITRCSTVIRSTSNQQHHIQQYKCLAVLWNNHLTSLPNFCRTQLCSSATSYRRRVCPSVCLSPSRFSANISLCLGNDIRYGHIYYGMRIGNRIQAFNWYHFQWPWMTSNPHLKITILFNVK